MWEYFLVGWTCFVLLVFLHLILDYLYYYSNLPKKIRKIIRAFTEE